MSSSVPYPPRLQTYSAALPSTAYNLLGSIQTKGTISFSSRDSSLSISSLFPMDDESHPRSLHLALVLPNPSLKIFVSGLDPNASEDNLRQLFGQYGELVHVKIPVGKRCGFVQFASREKVEEALLMLNGTQLGSHNIRLSWGRSPSAKQVWDVLSNKEVVDIVASTSARSSTARSLVESVLKSGELSESLNATKAGNNKEALLMSLDRSGTIRSDSEIHPDEVKEVSKKQMARPPLHGQSLDGNAVSGEGEVWFALEGMSRHPPNTAEVCCR